MAEYLKQTGEKVPDNFSVNEEEVHIMPTKFVIKKNPKKKDGGAKGIIVFFVIFFILLMGGLGVAYYFYQQKNKPADTNTNTDQNTNTIATSTNQNTNQNTNTSIITNTNTDTNQNTNSNININTNTNTNITTTTATQITVDTDSDGLTDLEESTYQTDKQVADSDKDGYKDGDELKNLYDPLASNQKLIDSGLVIRYANDLSGYAIFSPKPWLVKAVDDYRKKIEFIPDSSTSELVRIEILENTNLKNTLVDWQKSLYVGETMENFTLGGRAALRSTDKKRVLAVNSNFIYIIIYEVSGPDANFNTTFDMMLASFAFVNPTP
jgi:hypothetical protein